MNTNTIMSMNTIIITTMATTVGAAADMTTIMKITSMNMKSTSMHIITTIITIMAMTAGAAADMTTSMKTTSITTMITTLTTSPKTNSVSIS